MQDQSPYGNLNISIKGYTGMPDSITRDINNKEKINQALKELGKYVNEAEPADGYHNDKVVDKAYKLLQEVIYGVNSNR